MRRLALVAALCFTLASAGCVALFVGAAAAGAAVAGVVYVKGEGRKAYDAELETAFDAAVRGARDLSLDIRKRTIDKTGGDIQAVTATGEGISIHLVPVTPKTTEIRIRVSTFGDKRVTDLIFRSIDKRIPAQD